MESTRAPDGLVRSRSWPRASSWVARIRRLFERAPSSPPAPLERREGATIGGRFTLLARIAEGGMGQIWMAEHRLTKRRVALKLLKGEASPAARRRVAREAAAACAIDHAAVLPVHDVIEDDDGSPVLVMDLLHGESLEARLARDGRIAPEKLAAMLAPVAEALAMGHAIGLVHRDLKPANLFVTRAGDVRVLDFGIAKRIEGAGNPDPGATAEAAFVGTPGYMSLEQALGDPVDARTDIWAFGLVLYEALSGELPTRRPSLAEVMRELLAGPIAPIEERVPDLPPALAALIERMLAPDIDRRNVTMTEVARVLSEMASASTSISKAEPDRRALQVVHRRRADRRWQREREPDVEGAREGPAIVGRGIFEPGVDERHANRFGVEEARAQPRAEALCDMGRIANIRFGGGAAIEPAIVQVLELEAEATPDHVQVERSRAGGARGRRHPEREVGVGAAREQLHEATRRGERRSHPGRRAGESHVGQRARQSSAAPKLGEGDRHSRGEQIAPRALEGGRLEGVGVAQQE